MTALLLFLCGVGAGVLSAWGVGGGTVLLLCLTLGFGVEGETARGINLLFFLAASGMGLWFHRRGKLVDSAAVGRALLPGLAAAAAGALLSLRVEAASLERAFGVLLLAEGISALIHRVFQK